MGDKKLEKERVKKEIEKRMPKWFLKLKEAYEKKYGKELELKARI